MTLGWRLQPGRYLQTAASAAEGASKRKTQDHVSNTGTKRSLIKCQVCLESFQTHQKAFTHVRTIIATIQPLEALIPTAGILGQELVKTHSVEQCFRVVLY